MEHCTERNLLVEHFLQTQRLSAQLDIVVVPSPALASLVLHGIGNVAVELNDIRLP
jgi:hypothetical protein